MRYRSYYYDEEIGLYYLQSRYYDAKLGRFINCDEIDIITFKKSTLITNIYLYCINDCINTTELYGNLGISSLLSVIGDSLNFIFSIAQTAVCDEKKYKKLSEQIKKAKNRKEKNKLIKEQTKLLKLGTGKGLYYVVKILGYILLVMPFIKYVLEWANDRILFVEFIVSILIDAIIEILCTLTSKIIGFIPAAGIMLGFLGSWLIGKLLNAHFNDTRKSKIAKYYNSQLPHLTTLKAWIFSFGSALSI